MLETGVADRIRRIFLQPRPHVSIMQAEGLLGWTRRHRQRTHRGAIGGAAGVRRGDGVAG